VILQLIKDVVVASNAFTPVLEAERDVGLHEATSISGNSYSDTLVPYLSTKVSEKSFARFENF
jgi:hypothetical protein